MKIRTEINAARRFVGDISNYLQVSEVATSNAVRGETAHLKSALRDDVKSAGLGSRLANTWRSQLYPETGASMDAAGFIWSKAPHIVEAFEKGVVITAKGGKYLAIPTENAPKRIGRLSVTPQLYEQHRGNLVFVKGKNGKAFLVAEVQASYRKKDGAFTGFRKVGKRSAATGNRVTTVVMFLLIPQARLKKRLEPRGIFDRSQGRLAERLYEEKRKLLR